MQTYAPNFHVCFTVRAVPVAQPRQRHRINGTGKRAFVTNYTPAAHPVNAFKAAVQLAATTAFRRHPPIEGPIRLVAHFVMPRPARLIWKKRPMPREYHESKPDLDNLVKSLKDALTRLAWRDDAQVAELIASKSIAAGDELPHVQIIIVPLSGKECEYAD